MVRSIQIVTVIATVVIVLGGCGGDENQASSGSPDRTTAHVSGDRTSLAGSGERTIVGGTGFSDVLAPSNDKPVPDVVGMGVEAACRTLGRSDYAGGIFVVKRSDEVGPGRVVAQDPKPGAKYGLGGSVHLIASEPFAVEKLPRNSNCVDRTDLGMEQFPVD